MKNASLTHMIFRLGLAIAICALMACAPQAQSQQAANPYPGVLTSPIDSSTAVRFFFHPPLSDRFVFPLVFRVAAENDERMRTAPLLNDGRAIYISLSEMKNLVAALTRSVTMGQQTKNVEVFGSWEMIPSSEAMDVFVIFSKGAARGVILRKDICRILSSLTSSIKTPRALWEFERFRKYNDCSVPGFDDTKYNDQ